MARGLIVLSLCVLLNAQEVLDVSADRIFSNQKKGETIMKGNVVIQKQEDILYANEVIIKMGKDKKPSEYRAIGEVKFKVTTQDGRKMNGEANTIIYNALKDEYRLLGKAQVKEEGKPNTIKGKSIVLNRKSGTASVVGDRRKPAKITFSLGDKNAK